MTGFGVQADQFRVLKRCDERHGVADGRKKNVAARLIGLGLDGESNVVALVQDILPHEVDAFTVALEGPGDVFGHVVLSALAAAPHHERFCAHLDGQVEVTQGLAQGEASNTAVVTGEGTVLENGVAKEVGGHHGHDQTRVSQRLLQAINLLLAFGIGASEGEQVVIVEGEAVRAQLGELLDSFNHVKGRARR